MHSIWWSVYQYVPIKGQIRDIAHMLSSNLVCKQCKNAVLMRKSSAYEFKSPISVCLEKQQHTAPAFLFCALPIGLL